MPEARPLTILCVSSYEKGQEFLRTCKAMGCRVLLLTVDKLRDGDWPRESVDEIFTMPEELPVQGIINSVSYMARFQPIDRVVALDEFDMENVSALREHLRVPGMGLTTVRYFRDKLAMRARAKEAGISVPAFVHVLNYDDLREYMERIPAPWLLKPRSQASGIGMRKIHQPDELWPLLDQLGDNQSNYLLEQFVPGNVYHVDSVTSEWEVVFAEAHAYGTPPLDTSHHGGVFTTRSLPRDAVDTQALLDLNQDLLDGLGLMRGVTHAEFLKSHADGKFYFIEVAARVGGAYISDVVETATGINLWREWARLEVGAGKRDYQLPEVRRDYAGAILSLARQEHPDTSAYNDPEIIYRVAKYHHAGFILRSDQPEKITELLTSYGERFVRDFMAVQPVPDRPSS
ncbi:MAG TPA: ATP-grasp domain-containing protein [Candidatus Saccharimonadales bacterium]|jgi:biotin carboxylase|nr:ATP-grasp domain-containing protein [Candidatus Saccharimonadales bacterium]